VDLSPPIRDGQIDQAYANPRDEVTVLVPSSARRILDVGSSVGIMGAALKRRGCDVTGIESSPVLAQEARGRLDRVVEADVELLAAQGQDPGGPFDCVVMADVLEHLRDPWSVTRWAAQLVDDGGSLVISVPNIRHLHLFWAVGVRRRWPYRAVGIFDRTHLRWFAFGNLEELLEGTGFHIVELQRSFRLTLEESRINRIASKLGDFGTLQFIFRAERLHGGP
jgi:2-polyprenyl-3-methyl-5-hydroxy-6-metoxy-1,4-benzoquinol methylase